MANTILNILIALPVAHLVVFSVLALFRLARLWSFYVMSVQTLMQLSFAGMLYYAVPEAPGYPNSPLWYIPLIVALPTFAIGIIAALNKGHREPLQTVKPGLKDWFSLTGGILLIYTGAAACLLAVYYEGYIVSPPTLQAGVVCFLVLAALGTYFYYRFSTGSRLTTWLAFGLLYIASPGIIGHSLSLIFIYSVPDKIPYDGLAVQCSISSLCLALLVWGINRKRIVV